MLTMTIVRFLAEWAASTPEEREARLVWGSSALTRDVPTWPPCTRWTIEHIHVQRICKIVQLTYTRGTIQHISTYQSRTLPRWWKQWLRRSSATNRSRISTKSLRRSAGEGKKWRRRYRIGNCLIVQEVQQSLGEKWTLRKVSWDVIWASLCPPVLVSWCPGPSLCWYCMGRLWHALARPGLP